MKRIKKITEGILTLLCWIIINGVLSDKYSSTPIYYGYFKSQAFFYLLDSSLLFLIPFLYGLNVAFSLTNVKKGALLKWIYGLIVLGLLPHIIFWLDQVISYVIYAKIFQTSLFIMVVILVLFLLFTFLSFKRLFKINDQS